MLGVLPEASGKVDLTTNYELVGTLAQRFVDAHTWELSVVLFRARIQR